MRQIIYSPKCLYQVPGEPPTYTIPSINIDNNRELVNFTIARGMSIKTFTISMQKAQEIGFINMQALEQFIK